MSSKTAMWWRFTCEGFRKQSRNNATPDPGDFSGGRLRMVTGAPLEDWLGQLTESLEMLKFF